MRKRRRLKSRGYLTPDAGENPKIVNVFRDLGWRVTRVTTDFTSATDHEIATKYGKGRSVLLTYDRTAYIHNKKDKEGFIGYIEHPLPTKDSIDVFCFNLKNTLSTYTSSHISGHRIVIDEQAESLKKIRIDRKDK